MEQMGIIPGLLHKFASSAVHALLRARVGQLCPALV
jgi:hypothetical protein